MKKGTRYAKKDNKKRKISLFQIISLIIVIACIVYIVNWHNENESNNEIIKEIKQDVIEEENEERKYNINFKKLKQINPDTVGWIKINGINIEYPIVKYSDNDFYLKHSFDKTYNSAGWIFMDYRNKLDGTDKNIIIYGHNRKNKSMFSSLKNILNERWYNEEKNREIMCITEKKIYKYYVFSIYQEKKENYDNTTNFQSKEQFMEYVNKAKQNSIYDFNVNVLENDTILTLSTCADNNNYRVILHAKK